jgi:hypothetical protein
MLERIVLSDNEFRLNDCEHRRQRRRAWVDAGTLVVAGLSVGRGAQDSADRARRPACAQPAVPIAAGIGRPGRRAVATS